MIWIYIFPAFLWVIYIIYTLGGMRVYAGEREHSGEEEWAHANQIVKDPWPPPIYWDDPGTALFSASSYLRVLWIQGENLIPDLKITPAPWAFILWDPSTCRASSQSQDCQQMCAGKDLTSRVSLIISAWAPRVGQPWEQASRVAGAV